jgi:hypothetical protein
MRILFLSQGYSIEDHPGWQYSLQRLEREGVISFFLNVPVRGYLKEHGWKLFYKHVIQLCKETHFDVVYFHYFHHGNTFGKVISPKECIQRIRLVLPDVVILTSSGDGFSDGWMKPDYPIEFKECSRSADITFSTQMGKAANKMVLWGAKNIVYTPNSTCPVRFKAHHIDPMTHSFDFDVVFVGSRNVSRIWNPFNRNSYESHFRSKLVNTLATHYGKRFGLFGNNWDGVLPSQGPIPFNDQQKTFQRGRIIVGGNPYSHSDYYSSNRLFFEISSGIPTVELSVPRLNRVLRDQDHCYFCESIYAIIATCDRLLKMDLKDLYLKSARAADYIAENHTQYHRMKFKLETAFRYLRNGRKLDVVFPFFLSEVNLEVEKNHALRSNGNVF